MSSVVGPGQSPDPLLDGWQKPTFDCVMQHSWPTGQSMLPGSAMAASFMHRGPVLPVPESPASPESGVEPASTTIGSSMPSSELHALAATSEATHARASNGRRRLLAPDGMLSLLIGLREAHVLIEGETGTGKEVLAESLHEASPRADGPFVIVDCTTIAPNLLEAELFGYERGAFTGAVASRDGLFFEANGGTLFLDEIGDIDLGLQAKLLRAIEKNEVRRIGSNRWTSVDIRIIAATRRDLDHEVQAQRFRDDLFFRLAVARVELPPLRRRRGDISFLAAHFWSALGGHERGIPADVLQRYEARDWPGNVRELHNAIAHLVALGDDPTMLAHAERAADSRAALDLTAHVDRAIAAGTNIARAREEVVAAFDRAYTDRMLEIHGGNVTRAAAASGIGRRYFQMLRARK
jgi:two-component system response regulator HydG